MSINKFTDFPLAGVYESISPRYAGFVLRENDREFSYIGGFGDWVVYARPFDIDGQTPSCYGDDYSHPFVFGRDIGKLIDEG
jgi:hypothetical protein